MATSFVAMSAFCMQEAGAVLLQEHVDGNRDRILTSNPTWAEVKEGVKA